MSSDLRKLPKLKPAIKERWLTALRSGRYQQTNEVLRHVDDEGLLSYCCLGVLADVVKDDAGLKLEWEDNEYQEAAVIDGSAVVLSRTILDHILDPAVTFDNEDAVFSPLIRRNDGGINDRTNGEFRRQNFKQIAALIEAHC